MVAHGLVKAAISNASQLFYDCVPPRIQHYLINDMSLVCFAKKNAVPKIPLPKCCIFFGLTLKLLEERGPKCL